MQELTLLIDLELRILRIFLRIVSSVYELLCNFYELSFLVFHSLGVIPVSLQKKIYLCKKTLHISFLFYNFAGEL